MKLDINHFNSLISLVEHFNSDKRCRDFITEQRWGKTVVCPFCGSAHVYTCSNGDNQFKCGDCHNLYRGDAPLSDKLAHGSVTFP